MRAAQRAAVVFLVCATAACTHDFGAFEPELGGNPEGSTPGNGSGADASLPDGAVDGGTSPAEAAPPDDVVTPPPPADGSNSNCGAPCRTEALSCAGTCAQIEQSCAAACDGGTCEQDCVTKQNTCTNQCVTDCETCTSQAGCLDVAGCKAAAP